MHYFRTIEMMYKRIGEAIHQAGIDSHPTEWLLFLCPGKREEYGPWFEHLQDPTEEVAKLMRRTRRGPIYVHSKMMIVDDVYIILGSANINQAWQIDLHTYYSFFFILIPVVVYTMY